MFQSHFELDQTLARQLHCSRPVTQACSESTQENTYGLLHELASRFQTASNSLERSYKDLQETVRTLSTQLQKEREERIRLERLAAMGEMAMELAHEIRNPLGSIELYASMTDGEYAQQIVRSVRLLNHTVSNILQFGTAIHPILNDVRFSQLLNGVRDLLQPLAEKKNVAITISCDSDCTGSADFELLHRMLLNLVLNALRVTPAHGEIRLFAATQANDIWISVEDTGPGIPAQTLSRIFDPMFSTSTDGCGLGLPIAKRVVESHAGTIDVTSSPAGTIFQIYLTAAARNRDDIGMREVMNESAPCRR
jgi:two-component system sensor histidine kinase FlrB